MPSVEVLACFALQGGGDETRSSYTWLVVPKKEIREKQRL